MDKEERWLPCRSWWEAARCHRTTMPCLAGCDDGRDETGLRLCLWVLEPYSNRHLCASILTQHHEGKLASRCASLTTLSASLLPVHQ